MNVSGHSTISMIVEGGNRVLPGHLTIALAKNASLTLANGAAIIKSTLTESGDVGSSFINNATVSTWSSSRIEFGTAVKGIGSFHLENRPEYGSFGSTVQFDGAVGTGQSIAIDQGTVQVAEPMKFHATVTHLNATPETQPGDLGNGSVVLEGLHATTGQYTGNDMILWDGGTIVADIHVKATAAPALFVSNQPFGGAVYLTGYAMPGSTEFHAGSPFIHIA